MADYAPNYGTGSPERVAYDLYSELKIHLPDVENEKFADMVGRRLALYEQCLTATKFRRIDTSELK